MKNKAAKVLLAYYLFMGGCSLIFSWLHIHSYYFDYAGQKAEFEPILIPSILGGIAALWLTVPLRSLKIFLLIYSCLWILRITLIYVANTVKDITIFHRIYRIDLIINNYYKTVSRLDTHLPFVLFWFANYLFSTVLKHPAEKPDKVSTGTE
jgi:hypothetical protein